MNIRIFFAIIAVVVIWFLMKKTTLGLKSVPLVSIRMRQNTLRCHKTDHYPFCDHFWCSCWYGGSSREGLGIYSNVYVQTSSMSVSLTEWPLPFLRWIHQLEFPFAAFLFGALQIGSWYEAHAIPWRSRSSVTASIIFFVIMLTTYRKDDLDAFS